MLLILLLVHLILLINTRFTLWPEMVVYPYLLNNGFALYKEIINPYPPFLTGFLATFSQIFGYNPLPYQMLTWISILAIDVIIYWIDKKIFGKKWYALTAVLFFVILSIPFLINGLWFDLIQTPFVLLSFYWFYQYFKKPREIQLFIGLLFLMVAFFIKQQIIWLGIWFLLLSVFKFRKNLKSLLKPTLLISVIFLLFFAFEFSLFWQKGLLADFTFWTLYFPFFKASKMPGYVLLPTVRQFAIVALLFLLSSPLLFKKKFDSILLYSTALVMVLFAYPRFDYFHLVPSLAILSLGFGHNFKVFLGLKKHLKIQVLIVFLFLFSFTIRYLINNWGSEVRFFEKDIFTTAKFLQSITKTDEAVYVQNGPDQILPLSQRLPVKPWADEFPWYLELNGVQEKVLEGLKIQNPKVIIYKPYEQKSQYEIGSYRPDKIASFIEDNYREFIQISDTFWLKDRK